MPMLRADSETLRLPIKCRMQSHGSNIFVVEARNEVPSFNTDRDAMFLNIPKAIWSLVWNFVHSNFFNSPRAAFTGVFD